MAMSYAAAGGAALQHSFPLLKSADMKVKEFILVKKDLLEDPRLSGPKYVTATHVFPQLWQGRHAMRSMVDAFRTAPVGDETAVSAHAPWPAVTQHAQLLPCCRCPAAPVLVRHAPRAAARPLPVPGRPLPATGTAALRPPCRCPAAAPPLPRRHWPRCRCPTAAGTAALTHTPARASAPARVRVLPGWPGGVGAHVHPNQPCVFEPPRKGRGNLRGRQGR